MQLSENAKTVLMRRYVSKDEKGNPIESIEGMFHRVADTVAAADRIYGATDKQTAQTAQKFYGMMTNLEFMPNSPTLMNAGRPLGQLSACFVLPVEDSMEGIFDSIKNAAMIHKSGGGTGFSFSRLRPAGSTVCSTGGVASGPISFMTVFDAATNAVKQGGTRRGANMGILRVDHPDILDFIDCKKDNDKLNNFNISVAITDKFMEALSENRPYELLDPHTGETTGKLDAKTVFDKIVDAAWRNGEPGIVFIDAMNRGNPTPVLGKIESTNPCGEQPLLPYEACNLGSINLCGCVLGIEGEESLDGEYVDYNWVLDKAKLQRITRDAVHFLDNVIDVNKYPLPQIDKMTRMTRKIGLGVMGFADLLLRMGVPYNSERAVEIAQEVMSTIQQAAEAASERLAEERGCFPAIENSIYAGRTRRNATVTTIAPTGSISIICNASGGCEPIFAYVFTKNVMDNDKLAVGNPILEERLKRAGVYSPGLMRKIAEVGSLQNIPGIPEDIRRVFVCAHDITPEWHVRIQAAFQKFTDNAVSKTINFPNSATKGDVAKAYLLAYELGCKGTTVYRDGSRDSQVLKVEKPEEKSEEGGKQSEMACPFGTIYPRPRPEVVTGITKKVKIGCGNLFITVNSDECGVCEVFTSTGKSGGCPSQSEAVARLTSVALRSGVAMEEILQQLRGIRCPSTVRQQGLKCTSCPDAIARTIEEVLKCKAQHPTALPISDGPAPDHLERYCPDCGKLLRYEGGCVICQCGFSHCG